MTDLTVIIPTRNPHYSFHQKISSLAYKHPTWQIIVVDDASMIPVERHLDKLPNIKVYGSNRCLGAGAGRNIALKTIQKEYTIFVDDDDEMHWDVVQSAMARMEAEPCIDVSFFLYDRLFNGNNQSALESDCLIFNEVLQGDREGVVSIRGNEMLLAFTNYPWNKVYRSSFLKHSCLRFSETPVQNDIFAHWLTLIKARSILLSKDLICTKIEYDNAERIGNTADDRTVKAFQALRETYQLVRCEGTTRMREVFVKFYVNLVRWLTSKCSLETRPMIFREHKNFVEAMQSDGFLEGVTSGVLRWEFWDMPILGEDADMRQTLKPSEISDASIVLAEMSRLKRLAAALRSDNEALRSEKDLLSSQNETLRGEQDLLRTQIETLKGERHQLGAEIQTLQSELACQIHAQRNLFAEIDFLRQLSSRKIVRIAVHVGDCLHRLSLWKKRP